MKLHLAVILFLGLGSIAWGAPLYALKCPGIDGYVSPLRLHWMKNGYEIPTLGNDAARNYDALQKKVGAYSEYYAKTYLKGVVKISKINEVEFRAGIRLQHDGVGLPVMIDGCQTIPLVAPLADQLPGRKWFLGDLDSWKMLSGVDQMLLFTEINDKHRDIVGLLFSSNLQTLSLREFTERFNQGPMAGYFTFNGINLHNCSWHDNSTPSYCAKIANSDNRKINTPDGLVAKLGDRTAISFHANGMIKKANFDYFPFMYAKKERQCRGEVNLLENGSVDWCHGFQVDEKGQVRYDQNATLEVGPPDDSTILSHLLYNEKGQVVYGLSTDRHGFYPLYSTLAKDKAVIGLHPNGKFRSGYLRSPVHDGELYSEVYSYMEVKANGKISQRVKLEYDFYHTHSYDEILHLRNEDSRPLEVSFHQSYWQDEFKNEVFKVDTIYQNRPDCILADPKINGLSVMPGCTVVVRALSIVTGKGPRQ